MSDRRNRKKDKMSYSQKKAAFWESLLTERLKDVREGLVNTGMEAHTRNDDELTSIMVAALNGKVRSLDTLLDYYERRRELRRKGWIDIKDENGRTALMMAAAGGKVEAVESLLYKGAKVDIKDDDGMTARDHAEKRQKHDVVKAIDEWLRESEDEVIEDEDGNAIQDGMTSTQRNKIKKRQMQALERRGQKNKGKQDGEDEDDEADDDDGSPGPAPTWPEVSKVVESVELLRPICEIAVKRTEPEDQLNGSGGVDPALWYLRHVNRLELCLAPGVLTAVPGVELKRLKQLHTLILNDNSLTSLPSEIGRLKQLKVLEVARNKLTELPDSISSCTKLETLDISFNEITTLAPLAGLTNIGNINACANKLKQLDLDYANLGRLHDLVISENEISNLPAEFGLLATLMHFSADKNQIEELPTEITQLKKIKVLKLADNPIKDPKVRKMLQGDQRKDLWKYLEKIGGGKKGGGKKGKGGKKKKGGNDDEDDASSAKPPAPPSNAGDDEEDDGFFSDDSFDITMDEL